MLNNAIAGGAGCWPTQYEELGGGQWHDGSRKHAADLAHYKCYQESINHIHVDTTDEDDYDDQEQGRLTLLTKNNKKEKNGYYLTKNAQQEEW
jgi:hypothetical protein